MIADEIWKLTLCMLASNDTHLVEYRTSTSFIYDDFLNNYKEGWTLYKITPITTTTTTTTTITTTTKLSSNYSQTNTNEFLSILIQQHRQTVIISLFMILVFDLILIWLGRMLLNTIKKRRSIISLLADDTTVDLPTNIEENFEQKQFTDEFNNNHEQTPKENINQLQKMSSIIDFDRYYESISSNDI